MKFSILRLLPLVGTAALAGCAGTGTSVLPTLTLPTVAQIQADAIVACKFEPDAEAVTALLMQNSTVTTVDGITTAICNAVTASTTVARRHKFGATFGTVVNGVAITGHFVQ